MSETGKKCIFSAILVVIACLSIFVAGKKTTTTEFHEKTIAALQENKSAATELMAASTAASAAITVIPGDVATPIASKLADVSGYFIVVICAIYLEMYLLIITGYVTFYFLIPVGCALLVLSFFWRPDIFRKIAVKMLAFGILLVLIIPASVKVSAIINDSYGESIEETLQSAKQTSEELKEGQEETEEGTEESYPEEEETGFFKNLFSSAKEKLVTTTQDVETVLNRMIDALAVMIVTSCVIPVLVILFFVWLVKMVLNIKISIPAKKLTLLDKKDDEETNRLDK